MRREPIHKWQVLPGLLTLRVVPVDGGFIVRINGKQVKKTYPTLAEAKYRAECGAKQLIKQANDNLDTPARCQTYWEEKRI